MRERLSDSALAEYKLPAVVFWYCGSATPIRTGSKRPLPVAPPFDRRAGVFQFSAQPRLTRN